MSYDPEPHPEYAWLVKRQLGWQSGEQGVLGAIVEAISEDGELQTPHEKYAVEIGGGDGVTLPLTIDRLLHSGWRGRVFEKDLTTCAKAQRYARDDGLDLSVIQHNVQPDAEGLIEQIPDSTALIVIDIDSYDGHVLRALLQARKRPAVIMVEHHDREDRDHGESTIVWSPQDTGRPTGPDGFLVQHSCRVLRSIAEEHGYDLAWCGRLNSIFVHSSVVDSVRRPVDHSPPNPCPEVWPISEKPKICVLQSRHRLGFTSTERCMMLAIEALKGAGSDLDIRYQIDASGSVGWGACMDTGLGRALRGHTDYILTIDHDGVFRAEDALEMLRLMQAHPEYAAMYPLQANRHRDMPLAFTRTADYSQEITETVMGHFGLTLIRTKLLEHLPRPWFLSWPNQQTEEYDDRRMDYDTFFWNNVRTAGGRIAQANRVQIGHIIEGVKWLGPEGAFFQDMKNYLTTGKPAHATLNPDMYVRPPRASADKMERPPEPAAASEEPPPPPA